MTITSIALSMGGQLMLSNVRMMRKTELRQDLNTQVALLQSKFADTGDIVDTKEIEGCTSKEMDRDINNKWLDVAVTCGNESLNSSKRIIVVEPIDLTITDTTTTTGGTSEQEDRENPGNSGNNRPDNPNGSP